MPGISFAGSLRSLPRRRASPPTAMGIFRGVGVRFTFEVSNLRVESGLPANRSVTGLIVQCSRGPKVTATKAADLTDEMKAAGGGVSFGVQQLSFQATLYANKSGKTSGYTDKRYKVSVLAVKPMFGTAKTQIKEIASCELNLAEHAATEQPQTLRLALDRRADPSNSVVLQLTLAARPGAGDAADESPSGSLAAQRSASSSPRVSAARQLDLSSPEIQSTFVSPALPPSAAHSRPAAPSASSARYDASSSARRSRSLHRGRFPVPSRDQIVAWDLPYESALAQSVPHSSRRRTQSEPRPDRSPRRSSATPLSAGLPSAEHRARDSSMRDSSMRDSSMRRRPSLERSTLARTSASAASTPLAMSPPSTPTFARVVRPASTHPTTTTATNAREVMAAELSSPPSRRSCLACKCSPRRLPPSFPHR